MCSAGITRIERRVWLVAAYAQILLFGSFAALPLSSEARQFVEIKAEIWGTNWVGFAGNCYTNTLRCVVGTNRWYVAQDLTSANRGECRIEYLFTGSNILEHFVFNEAASLDGGRSVLFHIDRTRPALPERHRSAPA